MDKIDTAQGRKLLEAATPEPWHIDHAAKAGGNVQGPNGPVARTTWFGNSHAEAMKDYANGELIVWLRNNAAALLDAADKVAEQRSGGVDFLTQLRQVNSERYDAWAVEPIMLCEHCGSDRPETQFCAPPFDVQPHSFTRPHPYLTRNNDAGIMFDAVELGGEVGELLNVVKKLEREDRGWRGSRAGINDFADKCADVLICLDKLARRRGIDLAEATIAKFNATSEKVGLPHRLTASPDHPQPSEPAIPATMKPWHGGDGAPEDWDGGEVLWSNGVTCWPSCDQVSWRSTVNGGLVTIIAYTPKPPTAQPSARVEIAKEDGYD